MFKMADFRGFCNTLKRTLFAFVFGILTLFSAGSVGYAVQIIYNPNASGVTGMPDPLVQNVNYGAVYTLAGAPSLEGYDFGGWSCNRDLQSGQAIQKSYAAGQVVGFYVEDGASCYAVWNQFPSCPSGIPTRLILGTNAEISPVNVNMFGNGGYGSYQVPFAADSASLDNQNYAYIIEYGSNCSGTSGTVFMPGNPSAGSGNNCWCKVTGYKLAGDNSFTTVNGMPWVLADVNMNDCGQNCSDICASRFASELQMRASAYTTYDCAYTVTYNSGNCTNLNTPFGTEYSVEDSVHPIAGSSYSVLSSGNSALNGLFSNISNFGTCVNFVNWIDANSTSYGGCVANTCDPISSYPGGNLDLYAVCSPARYTIKYHPGTCAGSDYTVSDVSYGQSHTILGLGATNMTIPSGTGWTFAGWTNTNPAGMTVQYDPGDTYTIPCLTSGSVIDFYGVCTQNVTYTITYYNGNTVVGQNSGIQDGDLVTLDDMPNAAESDYFLGWLCGYNLESGNHVDTGYMAGTELTFNVSHNVRCIAQWQAKKSCDPGQTETYFLNDRVSDDISHFIENDGDPHGEESYVSFGDDDYGISYRQMCSATNIPNTSPNGNAGNYCWCNVTGYTLGGSEGQVDTTPWVFAGYLSDCGEETCSQACAEALANNQYIRELAYSVSVCKYPLQYTCGQFGGVNVGGSVTSPTTPTYHENNAPITISSSAPTGCSIGNNVVFSGWSCNPNTNIMTTSGVTCDAQWDCASGYTLNSNGWCVPTYDVAYYSGNCNPSKKTSYTDTAISVVDTVHPIAGGSYTTLYPNGTGWPTGANNILSGISGLSSCVTFVGYNKNNDQNAQTAVMYPCSNQANQCDNITSFGSSDLNLYAYCDWANYHIRYHGCDNETQNIQETVTYGDTFSVLGHSAVTGADLIGYTFGGWSTTPDSDIATYQEGDQYTVESCMPNNSIIDFYAVCDPISYNISYVLNGGTNDANNPNSAYYDQEFTVNHPTRDTPYVFTGWGISGMDSVIHYYGNSTTSANTIAITSTTATTFKNLRSTSGTVVFYAQWDCDTGYHMDNGTCVPDQTPVTTYSITFTTTLGTAPSAITGISVGDSGSLAGELNADGYVFLGWACDYDLNTGANIATGYVAGYEYNAFAPAHNVICAAQWQKISCELGQAQGVRYLGFPDMSSISSITHNGTSTDGNSVYFDSANNAITFATSCSATPGVLYLPATGNLGGTGNNCWCRVTNYTINGVSGTVSGAPWVFVGYIEDNGCSVKCAQNCREALSDSEAVRTSAYTMHVCGYNVSYALGDHPLAGINVPTTDFVLVGENYTLAAAPAAAIGWEFDKWSCNYKLDTGANTATDYAAGASGITFNCYNDVTCTAQWKCASNYQYNSTTGQCDPKNYTVSYTSTSDMTPSDMSSLPSPTTVTNGVQYTLPSLSSEQKIFSGWSCDYNLNSGQHMPTGYGVGVSYIFHGTNNVTCDALWSSSTTHGVTYEVHAPDGVTLSGIPSDATSSVSSNIKTYTYTDNTFTWDNNTYEVYQLPTANGYNCPLWTCHKDIAGDPDVILQFSAGINWYYMALSAVDPVDIICETTCEANTVNLEWMPDGGTLTSGSPSSCVYGTENGIQGIQTPTKPGNTFLGWLLTNWKCDLSNFVIDYNLAGTSATGSGNTWSTTFGYGVFNGTSICSAQNDSGRSWDNNYVSYWKKTEDTLNAAGSGSYCWCRLTSFNKIDQSQCNMSNNSYIYLNSQSSCSSSCAAACANALKSNTNFRRASLQNSQ